MEESKLAMSGKRLKVLFLSVWCPYPLDNGSRIRQFHLLRNMAKQHDVTLFTFLPDHTWRDSFPILREFCSKVEGVLARAYRPSSPREILSLLGPLPRAISSTYSEHMSRLIERETQANDYDVFIAGEIGNAMYVKSARARVAILDDPEMAALYDLANPSSGPKAFLRHTLTRGKFERFMRWILRRYDACSVVSELEQGLLQRLAPPTLTTALIPNGVDTQHNRPGIALTEPNRLVFSGSLLYDANWKAMDFFLSDVFPLIRMEVPSASLIVTGRHDGLLPGTPDQREGVTFTGFVDDVRPVVAASSVAVVPLRHGAGTRLKVLEAMALGVPVVSTTKGIEGLAVRPGTHFLLADEPQAIANAVIRLFHDHHLRQTLVEHARELVVAQYDWKMIGSQMNHLVERVVERKQIVAERKRGS
jgi:polysaccharide biosynthesis protein PslH